MTSDPDPQVERATDKPKGWPVAAAVLMIVGAGVSGLFLLLQEHQSSENHQALAAEPKTVSVVSARTTMYRPERRYVGTLRAWNQADLGPQLVAAYLKEVHVRPGDAVESGQVLATLDCRNVSAGKERVAQQVAALEREHRALARETERFEKLVSQNFISPNEFEKKAAESASAEARLGALRAHLRSRRVEADDCVLRAPFQGEVAARHLDPGAFVNPGMPVLTVLDRKRLRLEAEVPERDYRAVAPGTPVELRLLASSHVFSARVARRSPAANPSTRTVRVEIDLDDAGHAFPVGSTGEIRVQVGEPVPALEIPMRAATVQGTIATLFVAQAGGAQRIQAQVLGESGPRLFLEPSFDPTLPVVVEGRGRLLEGDRLLIQPDPLDLLAVPPQVKSSPANHQPFGDGPRGDETEQTSL